MGLLVVVLVASVLVGWLTGGSLRRLAEVPLRWRWTVAAAVAVQVAGAVSVAAGGPDGLYPAGLVAGAGFAGAFVVGNRRLDGVPLVALGLGANALVVAWNGAMPVSLQAAARAGVATGQVVADVRHLPAGPTTHVRWLGDVVAVPLPVRAEVVSPGDVLVTSGLALLVFSGMRRRTDVVQWGDPAEHPVEGTDGEEVPSTPGAQEEEGQPRQATHRLRAGGRDTRRTPHPN